MPTRLVRAAAHVLAQGVDRAFASTALSPSQRTRARSSAESLGHAERVEGLALIERFYNQAHHADPDGPFFGRPAPIVPHVKRVRSVGRKGEILDLSWPSTFEPLWSIDALAASIGSDSMNSQLAVDMVATIDRARIDRAASLREKYLASTHNMTAYARWFRHSEGARPCAVLLHGYLGGFYALEERLWPVRELFDGGMDVLFTVLPFHGPRRDRRRGLAPPSFPSSDPRFTIEGMRQLVYDHRGLFDYLRKRGAPAIGVMGASLGGYSSALLATLEPLAFAVFLVPLASIDRFAHKHGRMIGAPEQQQTQAAALGRAQAVVSPLSRAPKVAAERSIVLAGEADRVTGIEHSRLLAEHFGTELQTFAGGHLLQLGRGAAFERVLEMLESAGLWRRER
jgi:pimeloyl-ACP methyl ester carboxylesterase